FHALLITVPIGAWTASLVFDLVAIFGDEPEAFAQGARWLVGIGIIGALLAAAVGFMDLSTLAAGTQARRIALTHMAFNLVALALFTVSFFLRLAADTQVSVAGFVLSVLAIACIGVSGFLGGELSYRYGVRVADEETQATGFTE